jgi:hypothetical protein
MANQRYSGKKLPSEAAYSVTGLLENLLHHAWADGAANIKKSPATMRATDALLVRIDDERMALRELDILRAERNAARARLDQVSKVLSEIYSLLYPPTWLTLDGQEFAFKSNNANDWMQCLSDRIRAIPSQLASDPAGDQVHG